MKNIDIIKSRSVRDFAKFIDEISTVGGTPWEIWFQQQYCDNCESVMKYVPAVGKECKHSFCELDGHCKFFKDMPEPPTNQEVIEMWLNQETLSVDYCI